MTKEEIIARIAQSQSYTTFAQGAKTSHAIKVPLTKIK